MLKLTKISLTVPPEIKDMASDFLLGLDAEAVSEDDIKGNFKVSALFPIDTDLEPIMQKLYHYMDFLKNNIKDFNIDEVNVEHIDRSSWEIWRNELKRVKAGKNIFITPPWDLSNCAKNKHLIVINPSMAFGTGHHETTKLCISYIEELNNTKRFETILDVGCGSAILSIAAIKLGVTKGVCFDIDPVAVKEARENIERNKVSKDITHFCGFIQGVRGIYDLIVANISVEAILLMKNEIKSRLSPDGYLILSGIPLMRKDELSSGIIDAGFTQNEERTDGEWTGMVFKKN
ncbi:MAG: 50S ribosomal protein L11 methyltransferase [Thermodesulfobacteriota bacterium]